VKKRDEPIFKPLIKTSSSAIKLTLNSSRPTKKANVFGNVDDESPERDRAKKKRDLSSHLRTQEQTAGGEKPGVDSRKRAIEDANAVAAKKQKPSHQEERKGSHPEKSSSKPESKSKYSSSHSSSASKGSATAAAVLASHRAATGGGSKAADKKDSSTTKSGGEGGKQKSAAASRREELLKQLKAVEDAIQRKRVKVSDK